MITLAAMAQTQLREVITLRVPIPLYKLVSKLADAEKRPVGGMARILVEEALEARNGKKKK